MNAPRLAGLALALALHGAAAYVIFAHPEADALAEGTGSDTLTVVASVSLEGGDLFTQSPQAAAAEAHPARAEAQAGSQDQKEPQAAKPDDAPIPQETGAAKPQRRGADAPKVPAAEEQKPAPAASAAAEALDAQQAAPALAARRDRLWSRYQSELYAALQRHKVHVAKAGDVLLKITIAPSGKLLNSAITQSSSVPELDRAALAALERSAPFPPIPPEVSSSPLTLAVPFRFRTR
jgi:protein TonB